MNIALPLADFLLACRYAYYVLGQSILPDTEYDALEAQWLCEAKDFTITHPLHLPGSDRKEDYPDHIHALALYYLLRHGKTNTWAKASDRIFDELQKMGIDPYQPTDEFDFGVD